MKIFVSSQVRRYQKFMADKNAHSWCGNGVKSPTPIDKAAGANIPAMSKKPFTSKSPIDKADGADADTAGEAGDGTHAGRRKGRSAF